MPTENRFCLKKEFEKVHLKMNVFFHLIITEFASSPFRERLNQFILIIVYFLFFFEIQV